MKVTATDVLNKILKCKGSFVKASWKSNPKPKAAFKRVVLEKVSVGVVRAGIDYAKISSVKEGIADGTRGEVQPLPWGEWEQFPYTISHKGESYIRLYPSGNHKTKTTYFADGSVVSETEFCEYLTPSAADEILNPNPDKPLLCFTVKANNILGIPEELTV